MIVVTQYNRIYKYADRTAYMENVKILKVDSCDATV